MFLQQFWSFRIQQQQQQLWPFPTWLSPLPSIIKKPTKCCSYQSRRPAVRELRHEFWCILLVTKLFYIFCFSSPPFFTSSFATSFWYFAYLFPVRAGNPNWMHFPLQIGAENSTRSCLFQSELGVKLIKYLMHNLESGRNNKKSRYWNIVYSFAIMFDKLIKIQISHAIQPELVHCRDSERFRSVLLSFNNLLIYNMQSIDMSLVFTYRSGVFWAAARK